ncbi:cytochrome P450 4F4-like isoform X2 [Asterias amurensis]|uniref:cytochrome P450 4F4-like isoform X2 n=1 Tax=Asterias amurensis TaxID=7602 RepID=UPI003AB6280C
MLWWVIVIITFATVFLTKICLALSGILQRRRAICKLPSPPGAHWLAGHQKQKPLGPGFKWLRDTVKSFPRAYTIWLGPIGMPTLVHPDTIKPLLSSTTGSIKSEIYDLFADWLGEGLAISDGAKWKRNRRLLTGSFHFDVLKTYVPIYNDCIEVLLRKMGDLAAKGQPLNIDHAIGQCTFDIILRTSCSHQSNCQLKEPPINGELDPLSATNVLTGIVQARTTGSPVFLNPLVFRYFSPLYPEWKRASQYLTDFASQLINARKDELDQKMKSGDPLNKPRDFLDTVLMARDEDGTGLTVQEISDEVNTFLFGGHDTTASTLTWVLYELARHPEHQAKVREEVDEILDGRDSDRITSKDMIQMEYMSLVIKEAIRMYTPVILPTRTLTAPYDVDGVTLQTGTSLAINLYQLHHNPTVWGEDHMEFKPSRFLPENFNKMDPFAFSPFSAGPRNCIGQQFALNNIKVFVSRILRRFNLGLVEGDSEPVPNLNVVVKPLKELHLTVALRINNNK